LVVDLDAVRVDGKVPTDTEYLGGLFGRNTRLGAQSFVVQASDGLKSQGVRGAAFHVRPETPAGIVGDRLVERHVQAPLASSGSHLDQR